MLKKWTGVKVLAASDSRLVSAFTSALSKQHIPYDIRTADISHNNTYDAARHLSPAGPKVQMEVYVSKKDADGAAALLHRIKESYE